MTDRIRLYKTDAGEWRWTRTAPNGETVAASSEGYERQGDALANLTRVNGPTYGGAYTLDIWEP